MSSFYWHDYETFSADARHTRPSQFAGIRTDEDLNIISDPLIIYCKPAPDFLPDPVACAITGITPQKALDEGLNEAEFCELIHREFMQPETCVAGYNSIRFDDEVSRQLFYRCFYDPYEREWKNGNSRWDLIDLVRMTHALRPDGIHWPLREDGNTSFRLENLTAENGIAHEAAHDALSDVMATIEVARLIRREQPRLFDYLYRLRRKKQVLPLLNPENREPVLHVSGMFPAAKGCLAVVIPVMIDPVNSNGVIVYDLSHDPSNWAELGAEEIRYRLFTPAAELEAGVERIPLKTVHANKCPALAPLSVLDDDASKRWQIDLAHCRENLERLESISNLEETLTEVFSPQNSRRGNGKDETVDPDFAIYSGSFFSDADKRSMYQLHSLLPEELGSNAPEFTDQRLPELLFRLRGRNWPETLSGPEKEKWQQFCKGRLTDGSPGLPGWQGFWSMLKDAKQDFPEKQSVLEEVADYVSALGKVHELTMPESADGQS